MTDTLIQCVKKGACLSIGLFFAFACSGPQKEELTIAQYYEAQLDSLTFHLTRIPGASTIDQQRSCYLTARKHFKKAEPIMAFIDPENYETVNQPNLLQVEEEDLTNIRVQQPQGFQVIEEELFSVSPDQELITSKVNFLTQRVRLMRNNHSAQTMKPQHLLLAIRNSIISVATTGITGFDSPAALNSLIDAQYVYASIVFILENQVDRFARTELLQRWRTEVTNTIAMLNGNFDAFDRFGFMKIHTNQQFLLWNETKKDWDVHLNVELALKNDASTLFHASSFNDTYFSGRDALPPSEEIILLGKQLFNDPNLSSSGNLSCSSCHAATKAFTDGRETSLGQNQKPLLRNAPTLKYAAYQSDFFYDKRAGNLEGQMISVILDENEFHSDLTSFTHYVNQTPAYQDAFSEILGSDSVSGYQVRQTIASYIRSLNPFNSRFDKNIRGEEATMSALEIKGANLFMGTAGCATCHFVPFFNGTVPPRWKETELENLGVPADKSNQKLDDDAGRYNVFHTEERRFFFKTPTIRNIALTAPYMHNGAYDSLKQVIDFYNVGGGEGLGLEVPLQTLPPDSLHLSEEAVDALIAFMNTLTDEPEKEL